MSIALGEYTLDSIVITINSDQTFTTTKVTADVLVQKYTSTSISIPDNVYQITITNGSDQYSGKLVGDVAHLVGSDGYPGIMEIFVPTPPPKPFVYRFVYQEPSYTDQVTSYQAAYYQTGTLTPKPTPKS